MTTALEGLPDDLPDDPGGLRAAVLAMRAELAAERAERQRLEDQNERLCHFIVSDAPFPRCLGRRLRDDGASWLGGGCGSSSK